MERELHSRRNPGHDAFADATAASAAALDTEAQVKQARAEAREEAGVPAKAAEEAPGPDWVDAATLVDGAALASLESMGFSRNRATHALHAGGGTAEGGVAWLESRSDDASLDAPLLLPPHKARLLSMTAEEKEAAAADALARAKAKREAAERESDRAREVARVASGKALLEAQRLAKEVELKRNLDLRRIEKEEEARARARVKAKLEEDRRARRAAAGLPMDESPEEVAVREAREVQAAAAAAAARLPPKRASTLAAQRETLVSMKKAAMAAPDAATATAAFKACCETMLKLLANAANAPGEAKFRRLRAANAALAARVFAVPGATDFLALTGFKVVVEEGEGGAPETVWVMAGAGDGGPSPVDLAEAGGVLDSAINNPLFGAL